MVVVDKELEERWLWTDFFWEVLRRSAKKPGQFSIWCPKPPYSGMSTIVVTPPAAAALVAVQ